MSRQSYKLLFFCASLLATPSLWAQVSAPGGAAKETAPGPKRTRDAGLVDLGVGLESARSFYQVGAYDQCSGAYLKLLTPPNLKLLSDSQPTALEQARVHYAACLLALGDKKRAEEQLRSALTANPLMASPDPVLFPSQVIDQFFRVKGSFLEEIRRAQEEDVAKAQRLVQARELAAKLERERVARLEKLSTLETVISKNRRWVAAIPFGVGQFQNGDDGLGAVFLVAEGALFSTAVIATSVELGVHSKADGGRATLFPDPFNRNISTARSVSFLAGASFLLIAGVGIAEAQLNFVEEVPIGQRPRAKRPTGTSATGQSARTLEPSVMWGGREAFAGVRGTF